MDGGILLARYRAQAIFEPPGLYIVYIVSTSTPDVYYIGPRVRNLLARDNDLLRAPGDGICSLVFSLEMRG